MAEDRFAELLIAALEEAVAYKQGRLSGVRIERFPPPAADPKAAPTKLESLDASIEEN